MNIKKFNQFNKLNEIKNINWDFIEEEEEWVEMTFGYIPKGNEVVKLKKDSEYYYQCPEKLGLIKKLKDIRKTWWYEVIFENGYSNSYRSIDLLISN